MIENLIENFDSIIEEIDKIRNKKTEEDHSSEGFVHYTKPSVIKSLIEEKSCFRFYCTKYMNDPAEGQILLSEDKNGILKYFYENEENEEDNFLTFIGSFISVEKGKDKLPLWRFYGKGDDNKDARGMCIELDGEFFDYNNEFQLNQLPLGENNTSLKYEKSKLGLNIYSVRYVDKEDKEMIDLLNGIEKPLKEIQNIIDPPSQKDLDQKDLDYKKSIKIAVRAVIDEVRYLFKSKHYAEEVEYRVVITLENNDDRILVDTSGDEPKFYIDTPKKFKDHIKEIIIGPAINHKNEWKKYFKSKHMHGVAG